jgi:hypothetical protein
MASSLTERVVVIALAVALVSYAIVAAAAHRWISTLVAPLLAGLMLTRHPRARFSAYVFFSAVAARGLMTGAWPLVVFGGTAIVVLQTPPAVRAWPRVVGGRTRA